MSQYYPIGERAKPKTQNQKENMNKTPLTIVLHAAAFAAVLLLGSPAEAVPPNKVPGKGYFDGDLSKNKTECSHCRDCKNCDKCGKCDSKAKAKKCCASAGCVKIVPARPDSSKNPRTPYWKRKLR